jgi:glycosyltransferase involved in cell wall biosynthesis
MTTAAREMRILQVLPGLNEGGVEVGTVQMAEYLHELNVFNMVASRGGKLVDALVQIDVHHVTLPLETKNPVSMMVNAWRLGRLIRRNRVTHVHARSRAPAWSAYLAVSLLNAFRSQYVYFLTTFHGTYGDRPAVKRWYNRVMLKGDAVIANSEFTKGHIIDVYGDPGIPIHVVHRGADIRRFDPAAVGQDAVDALRSRLGASESIPLILMVGRLSRWKGQHILVAALAALKDLRWVAAFAGRVENSAYGQELQGMLSEENIEDRVCLLGSRDDVPLLYRAADVAVSASIEPEAFGRVAVEAQAMETGIIATAHGGSLETVIDGETGLLVEPSSVTAMSDALARALTDLESFARMGRAGRRHVCKHFTEEQTCQGEFGVYTALSQSSPRG